MNRDSRIFQEYAYHLITIVRKKRSVQDFQINGNIYVFDSSTIHLCLNVFWWAKFRQNKEGIKIHTLFDITTQIPAFVQITPASVNDMNAMDEIVFENGAFYVFGRGYVDYYDLHGVTSFGEYLVTRAKSSFQYRRMYSKKVNKEKGVLYDQTGKPTGFYSLKD